MVLVLPHAAAGELGCRPAQQHTLKNGARLEHLLLDPRVLTTDGGQMLQDQRGRLGLAGSRLVGDDAALAALVMTHDAARVVGNGDDVQRQLADRHAHVLLDVAAIVDVQQLVRVDGSEDEVCERLQWHMSQVHG